MGNSKKTIVIHHCEIDFGPGLIQLYKGKPVIDVDELPDGSFVMYYCDKNEVPLPDSPKIICKRDLRE